jgi:hypothetical protein
VARSIGDALLESCEVAAAFGYGVMVDAPPDPALVVPLKEIPDHALASHDGVSRIATQARRRFLQLMKSSALSVAHGVRTILRGQYKNFDARKKKSLAAAARARNGSGAARALSVGMHYLGRRPA